MLAACPKRHKCVKLVSERQMRRTKMDRLLGERKRRDSHLLSDARQTPRDTEPAPCFDRIIRANQYDELLMCASSLA